MQRSKATADMNRARTANTVFIHSSVCNTQPKSNERTKEKKFRMKYGRAEKKRGVKRREEKKRKKSDAQICIRRLDCSYCFSYSIPKRSLPTLASVVQRAFHIHALSPLSIVWEYAFRLFFTPIFQRMKYYTWAHVTSPHRSLCRVRLQQADELLLLLLLVRSMLSRPIIQPTDERT